MRGFVQDVEGLAPPNHSDGVSTQLVPTPTPRPIPSNSTARLRSGRGAGHTHVPACGVDHADNSARAGWASRMHRLRPSAQIA